MNTGPILVIKHGALGDIIIATAGFAAIRKQHPDAHIVCLTTRAYADLLAQSPYFNEIWVDSKPRFTNPKAILRLKKMLRSQHWQWVYDLQTSHRSSKYQWLLKRPWPRISNVSRFASHGYTDPARHTKHALENLRIQLGIAGIADVGAPDVSWLKVTGEGSSPHRGEVGRGAETSRGGVLEDKTSNVSYPDSPPPTLPPMGGGMPLPYALLIPGGAAHRPEKRWPAEQYAALAMELAGRGITPLLIGTHAERAALDSIAARVPQAVNLCGATSLGQLADLARGAVLAVGNDTGPMHIVAACHCPSTVLFSAASNPSRSAPVGAAVSMLRERDLRDLSVDRVLASLTVQV